MSGHDEPPGQLTVDSAGLWNCAGAMEHRSSRRVSCAFSTYSLVSEFIFLSVTCVCLMSDGVYAAIVLLDQVLPDSCCLFIFNSGVSGV